ncbi:hypothetical protein [Nonomuraea dietziae]|uniref:hypothetical protein n=1 Tax=Nonomuraea dietziae TaxID=65515 RepID=UPI0031DB13AC
MTSLKTDAATLAAAMAKLATGKSVYRLPDTAPGDLPFKRRASRPPGGRTS